MAPSIVRNTALVALLLSVPLALTACDNKGAAERAGQKIDDATEKANEKLEAAREKADSAVEDLRAKAIQALQKPEAKPEDKPNEKPEENN